MTRASTERYPDIDLNSDVDYRVRIIRAADDHNPNGITYFEGLTRFRLRPLPRFRGIPGPRYEITPVAHDLGGAQYPTDYRNGADMIAGPGDMLCILLDRYRDPMRPYGAGGPDAGEAIEMALDVFCTQEGLNGIELG